MKILPLLCLFHSLQSALRAQAFNCTESGCLNEGMCDDSDGLCDCLGGFEGEDCSLQVEVEVEVPIEVCPDFITECYNGGVCVPVRGNANAERQFLCECPKRGANKVPLFGGDSCEIQLYTGCTPEEQEEEEFHFCVNGGTCLTNSNADADACDCSTAYVPYLHVAKWGAHCEVVTATSSPNTYYKDRDPNVQARWIALLFIAFAVLSTIGFILWRVLATKEEVLQRQLQECQELEETQADTEQAQLTKASSGTTQVSTPPKLGVAAMAKDSISDIDLEDSQSHSSHEPYEDVPTYP